MVVYALERLSIYTLPRYTHTKREKQCIRSVKNKLLKIPTSYDQTHLFFKGKPNLLSILLLLDGAMLLLVIYFLVYIFILCDDA